MAQTQVTFQPYQTSSGQTITGSNAGGLINSTGQNVSASTGQATGPANNAGQAVQNQPTPQNQITPTAVTGQPIDTSQPNTTAANVPAAGQNTQSQQFNYNTGKPLAPGEQQATYNTQTGQKIGNDLASKFNTALSNAQNSGKSAPQSAGDGAAGAQGHIPPQQPAPYDSTKADTVLAADKAHQQYLTDYAQSQSSQAQTESLTQTYTDLSNKLGIPALNTELMNMKNIINGTEQDIRDEVSKAGGFATNSQVLALTNARNKTMIQNYNDLLQTRDDAVKNLTTMVDLTEKDQAYAQQKIHDQLSFDQQNIQYADKALTNAQDAYTTMQKSEGWDGIYKAALATGDPQAIQKINSTMGPGFDLASMAKQDATKRTQDTTKTNLELAQGSANLKKTNLEITKTQNDLNDSNGLPNPAKANATGYNAQGVKYTPSNAQNEIVSQWKTQGVFNKNAVPSANYNQAKAWWVSQGLPAAEFDSILGQYKSDQTNKQYN